MKANPDVWIACAKANRARKHYSPDPAHWVSVIICRAADFVKRLRTGDWKPSAEISPEERGDPFSSIILFFIDAMRNHKVLAPHLKELLLVAVTTCYRELGEHEGQEKPADDLCREFITLVDACEHANDGRIARIRLAFVEKAYMEKHSRFFETIFRQKLPRSVTSEEIWKAYLDRQLDEMSVENACCPFSSCGLFLTIPGAGAIAQVLKAAISFRHRKEKAPSAVDAAKGLASAFVGMVEATRAIEVSAPFYRGETKRKPTTLLSVQMSPKANSNLPDLSFLLTPRPPDLTTAVFMDGMSRLLSASSSYFLAIEKCAQTPALQMLMIEARDKFFHLCTYFSGWYCLPSDSPDCEMLAEELKRQFSVLGERMEDLAAGFAEYEAQIAKRPAKRLSASGKQAADKSGRTVTQKDAAEMIGISDRELRNWDKGISRPADFPGYENWTNLVMWLAQSDNPYGREWRNTTAKEYRTRGTPERVSYKEDWKPHQNRPYRCGDKIYTGWLTQCT